MAGIDYITREELYKLVWKTPMVKLAMEFGLSDQGLAKICKRHHIPKPGLGYWAKVEHGKAPPRPPLPPIDDSQLETIHIRDRLNAKTTSKPLPDDGIEYSEIKSMAASFQAPSKVHRYPEVISQYRNSVEKKYVSRYGFLEIRNRELSNIEIRLTPGSYQRGCIFLHTLDKLFKHLGWELKQSSDTGYRGGGLVVTNQIDVLRIKLKERVKQVKHQPTIEEQEEAKKWKYRLYDKCEYTPLGILELSIEELRSYPGLKKKWADRGSKQIESLLVEIAVGFARAFDYRKEERIESEKRAEEWRKEEERRAEIRRLRKIEETRQKNLLDLLSSYSRAQKLRDMISMIEMGLPDEPSSDEWVKWAHNVANSLDPSTAPDEIIRKHNAVASDYKGGIF